jgi:hypothetical protein
MGSQETNLCESKIEDCLSVLSLYSKVSISLLEDKNEALKEVELEYIQYLLLFKIGGGVSSRITTKDICEDLIKRAKLSLKIFMDNCVKEANQKFSGEVSMCVTSAQTSSVLYRDPMYPKDFITIIKEMILPISKELEKNTGVNVDLLIKLIEYFVMDVSQGEIRLDCSQEEAAHPPRLLESVISKVENYEAAKCVITIETLSLKLGYTIQDVLTLIKLISYSQGDVTLKSFDDLQFFSELPLRFKPFVLIDNSKVILPSATLIRTYFFDMFYGLIEDNNKAVTSLGKRQGKYVEEKVYRLFSEKFSYAEVYREVYLDGNSKKENDLLVKLGETLLVVESKAIKIPTNILRGRHFAIKKHLLDAVMKAKEQAYNTIEQLLGSTITRIARSKNVDFVIEPRQITNAKAIVITLNELGGLHTNYRNYKPLFPEADSGLLVMTLSDLMVLFEIIDTSSELIDYLFQRMKFEEEVYYKGDEMDILGMYTFNRLDIDYKKYSDSIAYFDGASKCIDEYKTNSFQDIKIVKPSCKILPFWKGLIDVMENSLKENSRVVLHQLYRFNYEDQIKLLDAIKNDVPRLLLNISNDEYTTFEYCGSNNEIRLEFVLIKYPKLELFPKLKEVVLASSESLETHQIYLNVVNGLSYAGYFFKRNKTKDSNRDTLIKMI